MCVCVCVEKKATFIFFLKRNGDLCVEREKGRQFKKKNGDFSIYIDREKERANFFF